MLTSESGFANLKIELISFVILSQFSTRGKVV